MPEIGPNELQERLTSDISKEWYKDAEYTREEKRAIIEDWKYVELVVDETDEVVESISIQDDGTITVDGPGGIWTVDLSEVSIHPYDEIQYGYDSKEEFLSRL